jgi:protein TonB
MTTLAPFRSATLSPGFRWAMLLSLALHVALLPLGLRQSIPRADLWAATGMEVVLVNASTDEAPNEARALAQHNLSGGGATNPQQAATPLPAAARDATGQGQAAVTRRLRTLAARQDTMLTALKQQLAQWQAQSQLMDPQEVPAAWRQQQAELRQLLARIEQRLQQQSEAPQRIVAQDATRAAVFARYYDNLRQRLEQEGTQRFPQRQGRRLYGEVLMSLTLRHDGELLRAQVIRGSGVDGLDQQSLQLVRRVRFAPFDATLRRQADALVVVTRFRYLRDNTLQTQTYTSP